MQCHCLTKTGTRCKTTAKPGERFCWRHLKNCPKEWQGDGAASGSGSVGTSKTSETSIIQVPRTKPVLKVPPPLAKRAAAGIVEGLEAGETPAVAVAKTLDDLVDELGLQDVSDLHSLTEEDLDYFIGTIMLHENKDALADIVRDKIEEQNIRDPHAKFVLKSRELLDALAGKFCRCIKKVTDRDPKDPKMTESIAIAICRKGVIQGRGLAIPRFSCKTYPDPTDKTKYEDTPIFLPSKTRKKILEKHPGYLLYLSEVADGSFDKFEKLKRADKYTYLDRAKAK